jgi:hypothetical protein
MADHFFDRVSSKALGELLIEKGTLTAAQLEEALAFSKDENMRLGEALVRLGFITADAIGYALGEQFGLRPLELHPSMIDARLISRFPLQLLLRYNMLPLIEVDKELVVVVSDPNNRDALRELQNLAQGRRISPQLGDEVQIRRCLALVAGAEANDSQYSAEPGSPLSDSESEAVPNPESSHFMQWLASKALENPLCDIYLRELDGDLQVAILQTAKSGSNGVVPALSEIRRFKMVSAPAVRDRLLRRCVLMAGTAGAVYLSNDMVQGKNQNFTMQVFSPIHSHGVLARLRLLAIEPEPADVADIPSFDPEIAAGKCSVVLYDREFPLDVSLSGFLERSRRSNVILLSQETTRTVFQNIETLPDPFGDVVGTAKCMGATCIVYDHPVSASEVARALTAFSPPPAIVVFAPAVDESSVFSPEIESILALPVTRRIETGSASSTTNSGVAQ